MRGKKSPNSPFQNLKLLQLIMLWVIINISKTSIVNYTTYFSHSYKYISGKISIGARGAGVTLNILVD